MFVTVLVVGVVLTVAAYVVASRLEKHPEVAAERARQRAMPRRGWLRWGLLLGVIFFAAAVVSVVVVLAWNTFGVLGALVAVVLLSHPLSLVVVRADDRLRRRTQGET